MRFHVPTPEEILLQLMHGHHDRRPLLFISTSIITLVATIAVVLRFISARLNNSVLRSDDYTIFVALILAYGLLGNLILATVNGLGRHAAVVGYTIVQRHFLYQFSFEIIYLQCITIVKISILLFYRRLFDTKRFKLVSIIVASSVIAYWLCFTLVAIFQCIPVHHTWDKSVPGKCVDTYALLLAASVLNIINDIVIVVMPIPVVWCLRVSRQQKMGLTGLFLLGSFVCIASIVRVPYVIGIASSGDPTWYGVNAAIWTVVEVCLGIVCACLPVMRPLLKWVLDRRRHSAPPKLSTSTSSSRARSGAQSVGHRPSPFASDTLPMQTGITWTTISADRPPSMHKTRNSFWRKDTACRV